MGQRACVIPVIVAPSIVGIMLGSLAGVRLLRVAKPEVVRLVVIAMLAFAGLRALSKGLGY
jgi:uncharacterized membrane protein YfcA